MTTTVDEITNGNHAAIPLLYNGRANAFSACIARPASGFWKYEPFYVSYQKKDIKFDSHMVTIHLMHKSQLLTNGQIYLGSSSATSALVNGKVVQLGSVRTWLSADGVGDSALILSASSIAGQALKLTQMKDSEGHDIDSSSTLVDPNDKFIKTLGNLTSVKQLKEATTKMTTQDLLTAGSHFLVGALEVVKQFALSVTKLVKELLNVVKELGNSKYATPTLSLPRKVQWPSCHFT